MIGLVGGVITGISPCVLPVIPVVFLSSGGTGTNAEGETSRRRPYLIVLGLALSFSLFTLLGTLALKALPLPKDIIRWAGLVVLVLLGLAMLFPRVQTLVERPFARIGQRRVSDRHGGFVLGLALGAVYVPCAGPVLAAITVAGATGHIGWRTVALTISFAVGAAAPLLIFALAGRGVAERISAFRQRQRSVQIAAGVLVIGLAIALTFNVTDFIQRAVPDYTASLNRALDGSGVTKQLSPGQSESLQECANEPASTLQNCGKAGQIAGIDQWLNTPGDAAISSASLTGKVYLVDFWAYSCINCQRAIPHVEAWYQAYAKAGLEVIGVHTPEYAFEHVASNVAAGASRLGITYPIALDNNYTTWNNFTNNSWPADYLVDATGQIRHVSIGEGDYGTTESLIRQLLSAATPGVTLPSATGLPDTTPDNPHQTQESYLGAARDESNANTDAGTLATGAQSFTYPSSVPEDAFALTGKWNVSAESITSGAGAGIKLNFDASKVYLDVGGTGTIQATVDGKTTSFDVAGAPNIYSVVDRSSPERATVTITLPAGLTCYSFTFG